MTEMMKGNNILLADDEPAVLDLIGVELETRGHNIVSVTNGRQAIARLEETEFDLVISDVRMPEVDGIQVLKAAKAKNPEMEVIIVTGYADLEAAITCIKEGAFELIQKPFDLHQLVSTVDRALERGRLRAMAKLYEASQMVYSCKEPQRLPELIVEVTMDVMSADDVSLMLLDEQNKLYVACSHGISRQIRAQTRLALGERVAGRVASMQEPVLINSSIAGDPRFADIAALTSIRSSIVYPLLTKEALLGVLNVNRITNSRPFREHDIERTSVLASQITLALENSRLASKLAETERLASVGQVASSVAHEINNPLTYVMTSHEHIRELMEPLLRFGKLMDRYVDLDTSRRAWEEAGGSKNLEGLLELLDQAEEGARHIREVGRDLGLMASRRGEWKRIDLNEVIRSALRMSAAELRPRSNVTLLLEENVDVMGHTGPLCQVFVNLLVNAAQAMEEREDPTNEIIVSSTREGSQVKVVVQDNGPGIRPEHLPRIFEAFFTTKDPSRGTGLGLPITLDIICRHGGEMLVDSTLGQGTTFTVLLPAATKNNVDQSDRPPLCIDRTDAKIPRLKLLFIDDEPSLLRAYERSFRRDHDVILAKGGEEAMNLLSRHRGFDVIICDLLMPRPGGMEVYRHVRDRFPELADSFIFVTGGAPREEDLVFLEGSGSRFIKKPFDLGELRRIIIGLRADSDS